MKEKSMEEAYPTIYAYRIFKPDRFWYIKIGYTEKNPQKAIFEESDWAGLTPDIVMVDFATRADGTILTDTEFHDYLRHQRYKELYDNDGNATGWFRCDPEDIINAYNYLINKQNK